MSDSPAVYSFSLSRFLKLLLPVLAIALAINFTLPSYEKAAQEQLESNMLDKLLAENQQPPSVTIDFVDADGDLVCDSPADEACVAPEKLVFSFVGAREEGDERTTWGDLLTALSEATGLTVEYVHYPSVTDQLEAMARGELHVVGLNTGAIPTAVTAAGFQPVCTLGKTDGTYGYTMKLLSSAGSGVSDVTGLSPVTTQEGPPQKKRVAFVQPNSNSGFKAALIYLMNEETLLPERDYDWGFTFDHEASVKETVAGEHDAAPVASDILARMVSEGQIEESDYVVLYESERFPPVTIGHAHNLTPELRQQIADTLLGFEWPGTSVAEKLDVTGDGAFVAVDYKDDWANIRRIDKAVEAARQN